MLHRHLRLKLQRRSPPVRLVWANTPHAKQYALGVQLRSPVCVTWSGPLQTSASLRWSADACVSSPLSIAATQLRLTAVAVEAAAAFVQGTIDREQQVPNPMHVACKLQ